MSRHLAVAISEDSCTLLKCVVTPLRLVLAQCCLLQRLSNWYSRHRGGEEFRHMTVPPSCQPSVSLQKWLCCESLAGYLPHHLSLNSLLKQSSDNLLCNANMSAGKRTKGWPKFLTMGHFYLWATWNFLPLRKRALAIGPWVLSQFFFIDWKRLLSSTSWSSSSVRGIPKNVAMFFTLRAGFWKEECNIWHDFQTNDAAFQGVYTSLYLSADCIHRIFIDFTRTRVDHSISLVHNYFGGDMSWLPVDYKILYMIDRWAKCTLLKTQNLLPKDITVDLHLQLFGLISQINKNQESFHKKNFKRPFKFQFHLFFPYNNNLSHPA